MTFFSFGIFWRKLAVFFHSAESEAQPNDHGAQNLILVLILEAIDTKPILVAMKVFSLIQKWVELEVCTQLI